MLQSGTIEPRVAEKPAVSPDAAVGETLQAVARDILGEALAALDDPERSDAVAVHDFRKAMKRWRALLRLVIPFLGDEGEGLRTQARDLSRELAGARDAQGALDAFDDLKDAGEALSSTTFATIRGRVEQIREAAEETTLTETMRGKLRAYVTTATLAVGTWPLDTVDFPALAGELAVYYGRARRQMPAHWRHAASEELHELRSRVVVHRYQMELVVPLWPRQIKLWIDEAQRLRERLGSHHDLTTLATFVAPHQPLARWRSRLMPLIAARQGRHAEASARIAGRLFAERPKAFRRRLEELWANAGGD